jgi:DNA-binding transcriptional ArsR family regulator
MSDAAEMVTDQPTEISVLALADSAVNLGGGAGRAFAGQLIELIEDEFSDEYKFNLSFKGVDNADSAFLIYGIVKVMKQSVGEWHFVITDLISKDLKVNLECAALRSNQVLVVLDKEKLSLMGPELPAQQKQIFELLKRKGACPTTEVAEELGISVQAAGNHLLRMYDGGIIARINSQGTSGNKKEYCYEVVRP